ncbi:hypothetical protein [Mixta calida]|uniref:hypothetical protein n=1 Tax=Mixta calida TaxID=665913 RepID=UPI0028B0A571|nr:hypothetical protein [Mixta calida]
MSFWSEVNFFMDSTPKWVSSSATAFIGASIGGLFTLIGVDRQAKITRARAERESLELQLSVLKGVKGEISTLLNLYNKRMKHHIDNIGPGKMLTIGFPIGDDNFTFYEKNANIVAKLNDNPRDSIISIYTYSRSLIQSFKGNNELIVEYERILFDMTDNNKNKEMYERLHDKKIETMINYAQGIKKIDAELRETINKGFYVITQEIETLQEKLKIS